MNNKPREGRPRTAGSGKVGRFGLVEKGRGAGCRLCLRDGEQDLAEPARQAVVDGADLWAVAGGDGTQVVVEADTAALPVGIDGEHTLLSAPVVCRSAPGVLRVRVPRHRTGTPRPGGAAAGWPRVARLALCRPSSASD
ncbi:hypothetical protein ACWGH4_01040 [Streptomyces sp. NPDC054847]